MSIGVILNQDLPTPMLPQILVTPIFPFSSVTASNGSITYDGTFNGSIWIIQVDDYGEYNITATKADGSGTSEDTVNVTVNQVYEIEMGAPTILPVLNDNSWETISYASTHNLGQSYWSVGDRKQIRLNGTVGIVNFDNYTTWVYIIGFNHNEAIEGQGITFGTFKTASNGGTDVALVDSLYNSYVSSSAAFRMNTNNTDYGGWNISYMRNHICGTSKTSYSGTIIAVIPAELRNALKNIKKYTNNSRYSSTSSTVTATRDYFFLLSEYEVFGSILYSNGYEANYQQQYAYYSAGNSKIKYMYNSTRSNTYWWLRSPRSGTESAFVRVSTDGTVSSSGGNYSLGFAPGFCV